MLVTSVWLARVYMYNSKKMALQNQFWTVQQLCNSKCCLCVCVFVRHLDLHAVFERFLYWLQTLQTSNKADHWSIASGCLTGIKACNLVLQLKGNDLRLVLELSKVRKSPSLTRVLWTPNKYASSPERPRAVTWQPDSHHVMVMSEGPGVRGPGWEGGPATTTMLCRYVSLSRLTAALGLKTPKWHCPRLLGKQHQRWHFTLPS